MSLSLTLRSQRINAASFSGRFRTDQFGPLKSRSVLTPGFGLLMKNLFSFWWKKIIPINDFQIYTVLNWLENWLEIVHKQI